MKKNYTIVRRHEFRDIDGWNFHEYQVDRFETYQEAKKILGLSRICKNKIGCLENR